MVEVPNQRAQFIEKFPRALKRAKRADDLLDACRAYAARQRKFGGLPLASG